MSSVGWVYDLWNKFQPKLHNEIFFNIYISDYFHDIFDYHNIFDYPTFLEKLETLEYASSLAVLKHITRKFFPTKKRSPEPRDLYNLYLQIEKNTISDHPHIIYNY
jgi:hypothetical protein